MRTIKKKKAKKSPAPKIKLNPNYDPAKVIVERGYGIKDLENYKKKIDANIKIFKDAIAKEVKEKKRIHSMIQVLKNDIKEARIYKKLKKRLT